MTGYYVLLNRDLFYQKARPMGQQHALYSTAQPKASLKHNFLSICTVAYDSYVLTSI